MCHCLSNDIQCACVLKVAIIFFIFIHFYDMQYVVVSTIIHEWIKLLEL